MSSIGNEATIKAAHHPFINIAFSIPAPYTAPIIS